MGMKGIGVEEFHYKSKFLKIPSILFHTLDSSISQTSPQGTILLPPLPPIQGSPHTPQVTYFIMFFIQFE
jgi:hypothetical protein